MRLASRFWLPRKETELQMFLQNRPAYLTLLVLILCLAPLPAAAVEKPNDFDFAAQFDQSAPDNSAHPPARPSITRMNVPMKSMLLAEEEKTEKKRKKGPSGPADLAKNLP